MPVWRYATGRFVLEKRIVMDQGANVTRIEYANLWSREAADVSVRVIADHRDYHARTFAWDGDTGAGSRTATRSAFRPAVPPTCMCGWRAGAPRRPAFGIAASTLAQERARGLTDSEDHIFAGTLSAPIAPGATAQLVASTGARPAAVDRRALAADRAREQSLLNAWQAARGAERRRRRRTGSRQLVLAADQFIVGRRLADGSDGHTVIAGYHWFADWGRDTMISLPGLTLEYRPARRSRRSVLRPSPPTSIAA